MRKNVLFIVLTSMMMSLCVPACARLIPRTKVLSQYIIEIGDISEETVARPEWTEDYLKETYKLPAGITFKELLFSLPGIEKNRSGKLVTKKGNKTVRFIDFNNQTVYPADSSHPYYYTDDTKLKTVPWRSIDFPHVIYTDDTKLNSGTAFVRIEKRRYGLHGIYIVIGYYENVPSDMVGDNSEYVDLGLSVKWASRNVDADGPGEMGGLYFWGETETKQGIESVLTYKFRDGNKYNATDGKTVLDPEDDVAQVKWGGSWRMPTADEIYELIHNCTWSWASVNGQIGYLVTSNKPGYTDRSIFLPYAFFGSSGDLSYWAGSTDPYDPDRAACLWIQVYDDYVRSGSCIRTWPRPVRPVCP